MATDGLSGSYTYLELRNALRQQGIQSKNMNSALKQIASDNDINNIKELDGEQSITVSTDVFTQYAKETGMDTSNSHNNDILSLYTNQNTLFNEIYNDDDWEVADYDDYYNFGAQEAAIQQNVPKTLTADESNLSETETGTENPILGNSLTDSEGINYDEFVNQYANQFLNGNEQAKDKDNILKQIFNSFDTNSDSYLSQAEMASGLMMTNTISDNKDAGVNSLTAGGEDLLGSDMMEMDMSNDSFNPE